MKREYDTGTQLVYEKPSAISNQDSTAVDAEGRGRAETRRGAGVTGAVFAIPAALREIRGIVGQCPTYELAMET